MKERYLCLLAGISVFEMQVSKLNGQNHKQVAMDFVMLWLSLVLVNVVRNYAGT